MSPQLATVLVAATLFAQPATGSISGRVIDSVTSAPIAGAKVFIRSMTQPDDSSVQTGDDGRYTLAQLSAGEYRLRVEHPKYASVESMIVRKDGRLTGVLVAAGEQVRRIDFAMEPAGVLMGQITDDAGRPIAKARVTVIGERMRFTGATTNERGEYEVRVGTGRYLLQANGPPTIESVNHQTTFYPGVPKLGDAVALEVRAGDRLRDLNIPLIRRFDKIVRGRVFFNATSDDPIQITLVSSPGGTLRRLRAESSGAFTIDRLRPGRYILSARRASPEGLEVAAQTLDLSEDVLDTQLELGTAGRITGRVVTDDKTPVRDGIRVIAALMDGANDVDPTAPDQVEIDADGSFMIDGLFGTRRLRLTSLPPGWSLKSILINGREASPADVILNAGALTEKVQIVITRQ